MRTLTLLVGPAAAALRHAQSGTLDIYWSDVEGQGLAIIDSEVSWAASVRPDR